MKRIGHSNASSVGICPETQPSTNQVLATKATDGRTAEWTKINRGHVDPFDFPEIRDFVFGQGDDGVAVFDGTATVLGIAPSSGVYTLTKDICCTRIVVATGATIKTAGYRIYAREVLRLEGAAVIHADGTVGNNASGSTGGIKNVGPAAGQLGGGGDGGKGGNGGAVANGAGSSGDPASSVTNSKGAAGGAGSDGQAGGGAGGSGGAAGTLTTTTARVDTLMGGQALVAWSSGSFVTVKGGSGGGGGGGGGADAANPGGGGGGGGAGGGVVMIGCGTLSLADGWTGRISVNGGNGGDGASGGGVATIGGGGGAGGGGCIVIHAFRIEGAFSLNGSGDRAISARGGTGGNGVTRGANGSTGTVIILCPTLRPLHQAEDLFTEQTDDTATMDDEFDYSDDDDTGPLT